MILLDTDHLSLLQARDAPAAFALQAVSEARLQELAAKLGAVGPLSDVIVAERGRN